MDTPTHSATCAAEGCINEGITIFYESDPGFVVCGPCGNVLPVWQVDN